MFPFSDLTACSYIPSDRLLSNWNMQIIVAVLSYSKVVLNMVDIVMNPDKTFEL